MLKKFLILLVAVLIISNSANAAQKILFIPHDDRPVSCQQPAEVVEQLGYEVLMPPIELLTQPDDLWLWFKENATAANAAVVSSDALLYGGLIPSRSHEIPADILVNRVENFRTLRENNPDLKLYLFGSLMRTPMLGTPGDREEPDYYGQYGTQIFQYTKLLDKQDFSRLNANEKVYLEELKKDIPVEILRDYFDRRKKNFDATISIVDLVDEGFINYFIIGRDDNAPLSQTHRENRYLLAYLKNLNLPKTKVQSHAGIDEYAMLLLTRAVNDLSGEIPFVNVQFNRGKGAKTVPKYSDERIGDSIRDEIIIAGALYVPKPERADFVLFVNTDPNGDTYELYNSLPPEILPERAQNYFRRNAKKFVERVNAAIKRKWPVGIADIISANGSDNFLMEQLRDKNLLFKLQSYGGWNTATNTCGFALGTGILAKKMSRKSIDKLLLRRYLDDWAYQANVRSDIAAELAELPDGKAIYLNLGNYEPEIVERENQLMRDFARENLSYRKKFTVSNPWHRMFECRIDFDE